MEKFILSTDSTCDMPMSYYEENEIVLSPLTFIMEGKEYGGEGLPQMDDKEFYSKLKNGSMPKTSQITLDGALQKLEPFAKENKPLLHIAFSSGLSGTYNSFLLASEELKEKYPDWNVIVIDSLCASMGEGLYLDYAVTLRNEGKSMEETAEILERDKQKLCHFFTVNNLFHLQRGGRVSKVSAVFGSMLGIKPVLHVNNGENQRTQFLPEQAPVVSLLPFRIFCERRKRNPSGGRKPLFALMIKQDLCPSQGKTGQRYRLPNGNR